MKGEILTDNEISLLPENADIDCVDHIGGSDFQPIRVHRTMDRI